MIDKEQQNTSLTHTLRLSPVANICNQELREIITLSGLSVAHIIMQTNAVSLPHRHHKMREIYYILSGNGIFSQDDNRFEVAKGSHIYLPKGSIHRLENIGGGNLEHLVIAIPPFNHKDVEEVKNYSPQGKILPLPKRQIPSFEAKDGGIVRALLNEDQCIQSNISLAEGFLPPKRKANIHHHNIGEELYYVVSGNGKIHLPDFDRNIQKDDMIHIQKGDIHGLENTTDKDIEIICVCTPPYQDEDFIPD